MKLKKLLLLFIGLIAIIQVRAQSPVIISQPYIFQKYISVSDSILLKKTFTGLKAYGLAVNAAGRIIRDTTTAQSVAAGYGLTKTGNTIKVDSTTIQTIANFFPKGNTVWYTKAQTTALFWKLTGGNSWSGNQSGSSGNVTTANGLFSTNNPSGRIGNLYGTRLYDQGTGAGGNYFDAYSSGDAVTASGAAYTVKSVLSGVQSDITFTGPTVTRSTDGATVFWNKGATSDLTIDLPYKIVVKYGTNTSTTIDWNGVKAKGNTPYPYANTDYYEGTGYHLSASVYNGLGGDRLNYVNGGHTLSIFAETMTADQSWTIPNSGVNKVFAAVNNDTQISAPSINLTGAPTTPTTGIVLGQLSNVLAWVNANARTTSIASPYPNALRQYRLPYLDTHITASTLADSATIAATYAPITGSTAYVPVARVITAGYGITGGGDLSANRAIAADTTTVLAKNFGVAGNVLFRGSSGIAQNKNFFWDNTNNRLGINTATPLKSLTVQDGNIALLLGADASATTSTDATSKALRIAMPDYLAANNPVAIVLATSDATTNILTMGGGSGTMSAVTSLRFATTTTKNTTGSTKMSIDGSGVITINTAPTTSAGTYDILTRNTSTGAIEKILSNTVAFLASPTFTGTPAAPTAAAATNTTQLATTAFVFAERSNTATLTGKTLTTPKLTGYTVATLPAGTVGMLAYVTDALTPVALGTVVGGGAQVVPVFYNGTNWIVQ